MTDQGYPDIDTQVEDLKETIGRAIDASGHARFLAKCIDKRTGHAGAKELAVILLGARKNLQSCEKKLEDIEGEL